MIASWFIMIIGLITFAVPVALIIWLIVALVKKGDSNKKETSSVDFEKGLRLFYMYAVMLVMLFTAVGSAIAFITAVGDMLFPDMSWKYAFKTLVPALVGMAISAPLFMYHFKQTKE